MEKMMEYVWGEALHGAFNLCDRDCYPYHGTLPLMSSYTHALLLERQEVVSVVFKRTGAKKKHLLGVWVMVSKMPGSVKLSDVWTTRTPRCGWKMKSVMRGGELTKWIDWVDVESPKLLTWIRDMAAGLMMTDTTISHRVTLRNEVRSMVLM